MRFYAVRTEAIQRTYRALQQLGSQRRGPHTPSRAMRMATLYGHLQCRADDQGQLMVGVRELAGAWLLQPKLLRTDLADLEGLGWLSCRRGRHGVAIQLHDPHARSSARGAVTAEEEPSPTVAVFSDALMQFCNTYNSHKPRAWPSYRPRSAALETRIRQALQHAGGTETFSAVLTRALAAMPEFWRNTYPRGRSGADCAAALFCADRSNSGLGPEFWHVFTWAAAAVGASGPGASGVQAESEFNRARRLFVWGDHAWIGQGMEAVKLPLEEKRRLAELLEAAGLGEAGHAARQFQPAADAP